MIRIIDCVGDELQNRSKGSETVGISSDSESCSVAPRILIKIELKWRLRSKEAFRDWNHDRILVLTLVDVSKSHSDDYLNQSTRFIVTREYRSA